MGNSNLGELVEKPPLDGISRVIFNNSDNHFLASSWDQTVRLYDGSTGTLKCTNFQDAPVLDCCFQNSTTAFSSTVDGHVNQIDLVTNSASLLGKHEAGAQTVTYLQQSGLLVSGSWDKTLRLWDVRKPQSLIGSIQLPGKLYSVSVERDRIVAATSGRHVLVFDTRSLHLAYQHLSSPSSMCNPTTGGTNGINSDNSSSQPNRVVNMPVLPEQGRMSSLKLPSRCIRAYPDGRGYAIGSVDGRVSMEFFDMSPESQALKYAFKCHRRAEEGRDVIYPVHTIAFHPVYGTFATGGGDGVICFWDGEHKKRIAQIARYPTSVSSVAFNADGTLMAIASSYCYESGDKKHPADSLYIRNVQESDARPKQKK
mmetsp:Transcript_25406/g.46168  ORF Transcript_25406/g.46168 Transcript_25406/m.46168 type:complete len:369 (-) Transcript_25406:331-1437(-)